MPKLSITLKQHTPMIHFQYDQSGATLRATELKPKLDKFLIKYVFDNNKENYEKYLITGTEKALNYKVKISSEGWDQGEIRDNENEYKAYFGDLKGVTHCKYVILYFFSFNRELLNHINDSINPFFAVNNFGTRQNKGFGSFYPKNAENKFITDFKKFFSDRVLFYKSVRGHDGYKQCLVTIKNDYASLKKSKLFEYLCNEEISWEKKEIKTRLKFKCPEIFKKLYYSKKSENQIENCSKPEKKGRYIRAILGLAGNNTYSLKKEKISISIKNGKIERFKSPITFKIIGNTIYAIPEEIHKDMYGADFKFSLEKNNDLKTLKITDEDVKKFNFELKTPEEFDLIKFLMDSKYGLVSLDYELGGTK